jgi:GT2 family glycosyltransferase/glycosyltransferase involved in cell wall biosynthesis
VWGTSWRQRARLAPLYAATVAADLLSRASSEGRADAGAWPSGVTVIIPERDAPGLLGEALASLAAALRNVAEAAQVVVVVNGAPIARYAELAARFANVEWEHSDAPLGFAGAIERGLARAKHGGTYLLNNDMTLDARAIADVMRLRAADVFAIGSHILQRSADGRREETGFTDWYVDGNGVHLFHAPVDGIAPREHVCASGGAALFRTSLLREYLPGSRAYDPFYWEDVEWSVRARRDGYRVLFCPTSLATHRHRATTSRFYAPEELARIVERNRVLFDLRQGTSGASASTLLDRVCGLAYQSQRELASLSHARAVLRERRGGRLPTPPSISRPTSSYSFHLRKPSSERRRVLFVTPFAAFPPRHGGARRVAELVRGEKQAFDVALVSDEAALYDARSFADFDAVCEVRLVQRIDGAAAERSADLASRMREHCHPALVSALTDALRDFAPHVVVVEHAELAPLVSLRTHQRFVLDLHDAYGPRDFADAQDATEFARTLARYDAVVVCSEEDRALVTHDKVVCAANGANIDVEYEPSRGHGVLFVGPFRYGPNREGIARFLREVWPSVRERVPDATLTVLGGDESLAMVGGDALFAQPGVSLLGHRDDVPALLRASALTINPISGIRGSAVKLVEALAAGRVCVSTREGTRGFVTASPALVAVDDVSDMAAPVLHLLRDEGERHRLEHPDRHVLDAFGWHHSVAQLRMLLDDLAAT